MWLLESRLQHAGFRVCVVGYDSLRQSPAQILAGVDIQVDRCRHGATGAVHFVGHSLGGLFIRAYLQDHRVPSLGRVVLLGTPNLGSKLVDRFAHTRWLPLFGPTAMLLGTGDDSFPNTLGYPYYPVGVIAGITENMVADRLFREPNDGLVSVASTRLAGMADFVVVDCSHTMMRYDSQVAQQVVAFLRTGKFARPDTVVSPSGTMPALDVP